MDQENTSRSAELLEKIIEQVPPSEARLLNHLSALKESLQSDSKERAQTQQLIAEYEEAYNKLTAPANRLGIFLEWLEEKVALVALGDTEFVSQVDPKIEEEALKTGVRVKLNDAYAVVGHMDQTGGGPLIKISEALGNGRLRVGSETPDGSNRIVLRAANLAETTIDKGDEVRLDASGKVAVEHFPHEETRDYFFEDVPETPWEDVGGQQHAIQLIKETIEQPLLHPELYKRFDKKPIKGILLYGPPGCGKTLIGKATAYNLTKEYSQRVGHEVKEYFMYISGPKILNMWLGETERMVRDIFRTAREKAKEGKLVFIFMDEAESVLRTRSSGRWLNISNTVVPQFCAELDGLVSLENVVLILTSNRPDYIDPAVLRPERIDRKVKVSRPDKPSTIQILGIYLHENLPLDPEVVQKYAGEIDCARKELVESLTDYIWAKTKHNEFLKVNMRNGSTDLLYWKDLLSGALLKSVVDRAKDSAIRRAIANPKLPEGITLKDLEVAADAEFKENEIFPKTDTQEDWLKLLDYEPENVASVRPIGKHRGEELSRKSVI
ncbi:MAG TPA: AAA family ATPase [Fimbriimonadaceae bacterium]|jgi:proteasome-associated ATPase